MVVCGVDELGSTCRTEVLEGTLLNCVGVVVDGATLTLAAAVLFGTKFESSAGSSLAIGSDSLIRLLG